MINHFTKLLYHFYWSHVIKKVNKQFIHMFQYNVSHVAWPCCYTILVTLLPCCHASRHGKFMLHSYVALLPFTSNQVRNKQNMRMFHMYVSGTMAWWHSWCICLWDEMQLVEAKHLGCYSLPPLEKSCPKIWKAYHLV